MGKKKIDLARFVNPNEIRMMLDSYDEVTLFVDNARKYITIGCDANSIRIVDFGNTPDLINTLKTAGIPSEVFYGNHLYFVNRNQLAELLIPYILQRRLYYCPSNIAYYSVYN